MGYVELYPRLVAELKARNGSWSQDTPKMKAADMVAMIGLYVSGLTSGIERVADGGIVRSEYVSDDGVFRDPNGVIGFFSDRIPFSYVDAKTYVSKYVGTKGCSWKRSPNGGTPTYEPSRLDTLLRNNQMELLGFVRVMMDDYESALEASANALQTYLVGFASKDMCASFLAAMRRTGADLDVLQENPPTTLLDDIKGATDSAVKKSEAALVAAGRTAGKAAAEIGNVAGEVAGEFGQGFFEKATGLTIIVAGLAAYVAFH